MCIHVRMYTVRTYVRIPYVGACVDIHAHVIHMRVFTIYVCICISYPILCMYVCTAYTYEFLFYSKSIFSWLHFMYSSYVPIIAGNCSL